MGTKNIGAHVFVISAMPWLVKCTQDKHASPNVGVQASVPVSETALCASHLSYSSALEAKVWTTIVLFWWTGLHKLYTQQHV